ncbi:MAG: TonB-dependent receptor [Algibacter sp.]|uniref:TonB-dependent receptor n=1 Tax=Algibacter sp. TaxID=1872428 RepID=UPI0026031817|nr:TonB-dependent receptor [Algibacter sp.]MDG1730040.1 TonB-dependent receptor [Algibacter sp.]MDG2178337.1 TonB-dependent receptor [Algibacter sp.]
MRKQIKNIFTGILLLTITLGFAQRTQNDTINTGVIDVVKPYAPTISDAFKVKEVPSLDDEATETKKDIKYNIFSFPVASTFTPAKGKAAIVEKRAPVKLFDNYATLGVGTYTTILGEVYLNHALSRNENIGGYVSHHSSAGGIEGVSFNDDFSNSKVNLNYSSRLRDLAWNVQAGFQHQMYNWYGVPESQIAQAQANNIDVDHSFFDAHFGGDITFEDTYINSGNFFFRRFGDNQGSGENRFIVKAKVDVPINDIEISTDFKIDYLGGSFDRNYTTTDALNYGNFQIGISPTFQLKQDDLTLDLGVSLYYLNDKESGDNNIYVYPNITATYRLVNDVLIAYGGLKGDLIQNSYYSFANENPFVSPTLFIAPTDQLYNAYVGLKGKLSSNMSYNVSGRYIADRNKALFRNNEITLTNEDYTYGNSFGIVYDNIDTFGVAGEINLDVNRNFKLGIKAEYFSYNTDDEAEAWNLPDVKGSLFLDYQIDEHWFAGANLFYTGKRKDQFFLNDGSPFTVTLDSFFDANANAGYHVNNQLSVFVKANNIANNAYQKWQNFPVQSIQFLAGATYKFDF